MHRMGRDLLYKPQVTFIPEEETKGDDVRKTKGAKQVEKKAPVKGPRDLGHVGRSVAAQAALKSGGAQKAFNHTYFNQDSSGVRSANFNQGNMKALRGSEEATNLRKIVIPGPIGVDHPEPTVLQGALDLMGVGEGFNNDLSSLLGRQGAWAKSQNMTLEKLQERMAQLESMVELRKAALGRMAEGRSDKPVTNVTVLHAAQSAGAGLDNVDDVASAGTELIQQTAAQAHGLHARLAKMFGVKMQ